MNVAAIIQDVGNVGYNKDEYRREPDTTLAYDEEDEVELDIYRQIAGFVASNGKNARTIMAESLVHDYEEMLQSVTNYKGFYIGRYELAGTQVAPVLKRNQVVLSGKDWYTFYDACTEFTSSSAVSRMAWGCLWDETCKFIATKGETKNIMDSRTYGNYRYGKAPATVSGYGTRKNTGYSEYWKTHNIYDFAGNYSEVVQEAWGVYGDRGVNGVEAREMWDYEYALFEHNSEAELGDYSWRSTRPVLYLK